MSQVKLPYYPKVNASVKETSFGVMEISTPEIYNSPLPGRIIAKADLLYCLHDIFGEECFVCREFLYSVVAGSCDKYDVAQLFASFYRRYPCVTEYVNEKYYYGDDSVPMLERCLLPLRDKVDEYGSYMYDKMKGLGGKFLVRTHDLLYFAFNSVASLRELEGVEFIC